MNSETLNTLDKFSKNKYKYGFVTEIESEKPKKGLNEETIKKEKEIITEELKNSGKESKIAEKIAIGKLNKFINENTLLNQDWIMEPKKKVKDILKELSITDLKIKEFYRLKIGE